MDKQIRIEVKKIFLKIFHDSNPSTFDFNAQASSFENWDSLNHLQLVSEIEGAFNINMEMEEIAGISKPEDFISIVLRKKQNV